MVEEQNLALFRSPALDSPPSPTPRSQGRDELRTHLPSQVRNVIQGPEDPTALIPVVTPRPGAVGEDAKGEGGRLEPGRGEEAEGRGAGQGESQSDPHAAHHRGESVTWGSTSKIRGGDSGARRETGPSKVPLPPPPNQVIRLPSASRCNRRCQPLVWRSGSPQQVLEVGTPSLRINVSA